MTTSPCTDVVDGGGTATPVVVHKAPPVNELVANGLQRMADDIEDSPLHCPHWVKALRGYAQDLQNVELPAREAVS